MESARHLQAAAIDIDPDETRATGKD